MTSNPTNSMPGRFELGSDLRAQPSVALVERAALGARAGREIATVVVRRGDPLQRERHRLAVHQNDPAIAAVTISGRYRCTWHSASVTGQRFEYDIAVKLSPCSSTNMDLPPMPSSHIAVLAQEFAHVVHVAGDERRRAALRKPGGVDLFVHVPGAGCTPVRLGTGRGPKCRLCRCTRYRRAVLRIRMTSNSPSLALCVAPHVNHAARDRRTPAAAQGGPRRYRRAAKDRSVAHKRAANRAPAPPRSIVRVLSLAGLDRLNGVHDHNEANSGRDAHILSSAHAGITGMA